jgi:hypothetical protein
MWAIDRAKKIMDKARERKLKLNFNFYSSENTDVYLNSKGEAEHVDRHAF